jgi:hypothetical protein
MDELQNMLWWLVQAAAKKYTHAICCILHWPRQNVPAISNEVISSLHTRAHVSVNHLMMIKPDSDSKFTINAVNEWLGLIVSWISTLPIAIQFYTIQLFVCRNFFGIVTNCHIMCEKKCLWVRSTWGKRYGKEMLWRVAYSRGMWTNKFNSEEKKSKWFIILLENTIASAAKAAGKNDQMVENI